MEVQRVYRTKRRHFGRPCKFGDMPAMVLHSIPSRDAEVVPPRRAATVSNVDCSPITCITPINTHRHPRVSRGCTHLEGGWGEGIDSTDLQQTARYRRSQLQRNPDMVVSLERAAAVVITCARQNATVNIFEEYFPRGAVEHADVGTDMETAVRTLAELADPSPFPRAVVSVSWSHDDSSKLATAHCNSASPLADAGNRSPAAAAEQLQSYVWDVEHTVAPIQELLPKSPLCTLVFSPTQHSTLVGGTSAGMVALFDLREGPHPTSHSYLEYGHTEPVTSAVWTRQRSGMEIVTVSTDRQVCWWDARHLSEPVLRQPLVIPRPQPDTFATTGGSAAMTPAAGTSIAGFDDHGSVRTALHTPAMRGQGRRGGRLRRLSFRNSIVTPASVVSVGPATASVWGTHRTSTVLQATAPSQSGGAGSVVGGLCAAQGYGVMGAPVLLVATEQGAIVAPSHPSLPGGSAAGAAAAGDAPHPRPSGSPPSATLPRAATGTGFSTAPEVFTGHSGPVASVAAHPTIPGYFVSGGEWSTRLWCTEQATPVLSPGPRAAMVSGVSWSPTRAGVWFAARQDGVVDVWDVLQSQTRPSLEVAVSDRPLSCVAFSGGGRLVAASDVGGSTHVLTLSNSLHQPQLAEQQSVEQVLGRLVAVTSAAAEAAVAEAALRDHEAYGSPADVSEACLVVQQQLSGQSDAAVRASVEAVFERLPV